MLVLVFVFVVFFWLVVGAVQFLLCLCVPRWRQYALSAALWWAVWGPCCVALMMFAGLALVAQMFIKQDGDVPQIHVPHLLAALGWGYLIVGAVVTAALATLISWLHQVIVQRFTFALFRIYATLVSAGIGSVFGWCFGWWIASVAVPWGWALWIVGMVVLIGGFGLAAYRGSRSLRGGAPQTFAWVSKEEFEGT